MTEALKRIKQLYSLEHEARNALGGPEAFEDYRRNQIQPFLINFRQWIETISPKVFTSGKVGEAFSYTIGHNLGSGCRHLRKQAHQSIPVGTRLLPHSSNTLGPIGATGKMFKAVKDSLRWTGAT